MIVVILAASLSLQLLTIFLVFRLIRLTRRSLAWGLIVGAIVLMALRRGISLADIAASGQAFPGDLSVELVALIISALMAAGIAGVIPIFREIRSIADRLRESEQRFRALYESSPDAVFIVDSEEGRIAELNDQASRLIGISRKKLIGRNLSQLGEFDASGEISRRLQGAWDGAPAVPFESAVCRTDGVEVPVEITLHTANSDGQRLLQAKFRDITERKQTEQERQALLDEIRQGSSELKAIFDTQTDVILVYDSELHVRRSTPRFESDYGLNPTGMHLDDILRHVHCRKINNDPVEFWDQLPTPRALQGKPVRSKPFRVVRADGTDAVVEASSTPLYVDSRIQGVVSVWHDVTELQKAADEVAAYAKQLEKAMMGTLNAVSTMVAKRDPYTADHERRVGLIAADIAREMGWPEVQCKSLEVVGLVHDIGKIGIPAEMLAKPTRLSEVEYEMVKTHVKIGYDILKEIEFPFPVAEIVYQHHERMDGSGYPRALKGEEILPEARVLAVADVLESMASHRPYRPVLGVNEALDELTKRRGMLYDAPVVDAVLHMIQGKGYHLPV